MQAHPFPEPDSPELDHYMIYSRAEISELLERLAGERVLVTVYSGNDGRFAVTTALAVGADAADFEMPLTAAAQAQVLDAPELVFVAFFENVKIQFRSPPARTAQHGGRTALRVPLPDQLLRLQRREFFRVRTPVANRPVCLIPLRDGDTKYESLHVLNISVGGLAVMDYPSACDLPSGDLVRNCYLDLPGVGTINMAFRVVNLYEPAAPGEEGGARRRFGCQFVDLNPQARMMVQRYVNRVEAEQRKALGGAH